MPVYSSGVNIIPTSHTCNVIVTSRAERNETYGKVQFTYQELKKKDRKHNLGTFYNANCVKNYLEKKTLEQKKRMYI